MNRAGCYISRQMSYERAELARTALDAAQALGKVLHYRIMWYKTAYLVSVQCPNRGDMEQTAAALDAI